MQTIRLIIQLLGKGYSGRKIACDLKLSRNTVKQYVELINTCGFSPKDLQQMDDATLSTIAYADAKEMQPDSRIGYFKSRINYFAAELKRTGVTRYLLWEEYKKSNAKGYEYSQFCVLLSEHNKVNEATMHFEHNPAQIMMVDFAGDNFNYVDPETGELIGCPVFVAVLPYSGYSYAVALPNATQPNVIKALNLCLEYFGGVPQSVKSDNMRTAVKQSCRYEPLFTDTLQQWSLHNNITLLAARVRKPKDKASVETEVKLVYQRIYAPLRNKVYFNIEDVNRDFAEQLDDHHRHCLQKKDYCRLDRFLKNEKPLLESLPSEWFTIRHVTKSKVQRNYHITLREDWHHYSVPFSLIGKTVNSIYDTETVEIYYQHKRIALHPRNYKVHGFTTIKEHMPESHQRYSEQQGWTPEYFLELAIKIGVSTHLYIQGLLTARKFTEQTYNSCLGIMRLAKSYTPVRVEAACKRALAGQNYNYPTIKKILENNLDTLESVESEQLKLFNMPKHDNLRGPEAYQ